MWYKPLWMKRKQKVKEKPEPITIGADSLSSKLNVHSGSWLFVAKHCTDEISRIRELNDNPSLDERRTALLRGRIMELKSILDLPQKQDEKQPKQEPEDLY